MGNLHSQGSGDNDLPSYSLNEKVIKVTEANFSDNKTASTGSADDEEHYYTAEEDSICSLTPERTRPESSSAESSSDSSCENDSDNEVCSVEGSSRNESLVTSSFLLEEVLTSSSVSKQDSSISSTSEDCIPTSSFIEQQIPLSSAHQEAVVLSVDSTLSTGKDTKATSNQIYGQCTQENNSLSTQICNNRNRSSRNCVSSAEKLNLCVDKIFRNTNMNISRTSLGQKRNFKNLFPYVPSQSRKALNSGKTTSKKNKHNILPNDTVCMSSKSPGAECSISLKRIATSTYLKHNGNGFIDSSESDSDEMWRNKKRKPSERRNIPTNQKRSRRRQRCSRRDSSSHPDERKYGKRKCTERLMFKYNT